MPHNNSAAKRIRKNEVRRIRNKSRLSELKTIRKHLLRALHDKEQSKAEELYKDLTKHLDQAAAKNTIHKNSAARSKARIALKIQAAKAAPAAKPAAKPTAK
jgi:small subunit ribosomal protein S20